MHENVTRLVELIYNPNVMRRASNPGVLAAALITDNAYNRFRV